MNELQAAIARERAYQNAKWGTVQENPHTLAGWLLIAERELDEAIEAWIRKSGDREAKAELLQFVAVGYAWLQQFTGKPSVNLELLHLWLRAEGWALQKVPLEEVLGVMRVRFPRAWNFLEKSDAAEARLVFQGIVEMGMAALLQHGIVERGDIEPIYCSYCDERTFHTRGYCNVCEQDEIAGAV